MEVKKVGESLLEFYLFTDGCFSPDEFYVTHICWPVCFTKTVQGSLFTAIQWLLGEGFQITSIRSVVGQGTYSLQRETTAATYTGKLLMAFQKEQPPEVRRIYG
jgi:hypothetical protein